MFKGLRAQRLLALFVAGTLLLNLPLLALWDAPWSGSGWPRLPLAVIGLWLLLIVVLGLVAERGGDRPPAPPRRRP